WGKQHFLIIQCTTDKDLGQLMAIQYSQLVLHLIGAVFDGTDRRYQLELYLMVIQDLTQQPLQLDYFIGAVKFGVIRFIKGELIVRVVYFLQAALYFVGVKEVKEQLGIVIIFFPADRIEVYNVFKQPVLGLGGYYFSQAAVRAVYKQSSEGANF